VVLLAPAAVAPFIEEVSLKSTRIAKVVCSTAQEAENIQRALDMPEVRAFLGIVGVLEPLTKRGRTRVLRYVADKLNEDAGSIEIETKDDEAPDSNRRHSVEIRRTEVRPS
jgi:hypothetical protein